MATLHPIGLVTPTCACIYAPSRLSQPRQVSRDEFARFIACPVWVSFEADGRSKPQRKMAYGRGLDGWYIMVEEEELGEMNESDRLMLARCFLFSMKVLFAILYAATSRVDKTLYEDYRDLADDLKRWYDPDTQPPADAASVKARWGGVRR